MDIVVADVDVNPLVAEVVETVSALAAAKNNTIEVTIDDGVGIERVDEMRLRQCLLNLLSNACKFTENGAVQVTARHEAGPRGEMLVFTVSDTGIGMDETQQSRIFQPFTQADATTTRKFGGTGLGLLITRKLAQLMGGDVSFISAPGAGSTFTLSIKAERDHSPAEAPDCETQGPLVLVVDNEADARDLVKRALARLGCGARSTPSGAEAIALARSLRPALIVLDIALDDMSGWDVMTKLQSDPATESIPVLILSVEDDPIRATTSGAAAHLLKPVNRAVLAATISRAMGSPEETQKLALRA